MVLFDLNNIFRPLTALKISLVLNFSKSTVIIEKKPFNFSKLKVGKLYQRYLFIREVFTG